MKYLIFTLTMPSRASWNGRWSGENNLYAVAKRFTKEEFEKLPDIVDKDFRYRWSDGWCANINVKLVESAKEKNKLVKNSKGFCGYDWMITSLLNKGYIEV